MALIESNKLKVYYEKAQEIVKTIINDAFFKESEKSQTNEKYDEFDRFIASYGMILIAAIVNSIGVYMCAIRRKNKSFETVLSRDELMKLPLMLSCSLFGIFCFLKMISVEYITFAIQIYTLLYGLVSLGIFLSIITSYFWPSSLYPNRSFKVSISEKDANLLLYEVFVSDFAGFALSTVIVVTYYLKRHWILNNIVAASFTFSLLDSIILDKFWHSFMLFFGLFLYDIFWVYGTNVMVTVAKKIDAPLMFKLPYKVLEPVSKIGFSGLGLGDVAVPGLFLAFLARFDLKKQRKGFHYFGFGMFMYILSLLICTFVVNYTGHGQPAFFYIVPLLFSGTFLQALCNREFSELIAFNAENPEEKNKKE